MMLDQAPSNNTHINHEKSHVAERLSYVGYGSLTVIVVVGTLLGSPTINVDDLKVAWVGATTSLITWLIAKARFDGNGK